MRDDTTPVSIVSESLANRTVRKDDIGASFHYGRAACHHDDTTRFGARAAVRRLLNVTQFSGGTPDGTIDNLNNTRWYT